MVGYFLLLPRSDLTSTWMRLNVSCDGCAHDVFLPYVRGASYILRARANVELNRLEGDVRVKRIGGTCAFSAWARMAFASKDCLLRFDGFEILVHGSSDARKSVAGAIRRMRKSGTPVDGPVFKKFPELLTGWKTRALTGALMDDNVQLRACVVFHIYYEDVWEDVETLLRSMPATAHLIVTMSPGKCGLMTKIKKSIPHAKICIFENIGKDVRPFLLLLERGELDEFDIVCKIHGKKSTAGGRNPILGDIWRNRMLFDLIGAPGAIEAIATRFAQHGDVGLIGPTAYRYPSRLCNLKRSWGNNKPRVLEISRRLGVAESDFVLDFFCGTMFWARPAALQPLRALRLTEAFRPEDGGIDGQLEHAVERLFATSAECASYRVEGVTGADLTFSETRL